MAVHLAKAAAAGPVLLVEITQRASVVRGAQGLHLQLLAHQ
jgi:hypothetical protein